MSGSGRPPPTGYRALLSIACVMVVIAGLRAASAILQPVVIAAFIASLTLPPVTALRRRGVPVWASVLVVFLSFATVAVGTTLLLGNSLRDFAKRLPVYRERLTAITEQGAAWLTENGFEVSAETISQNFDAGRMFELAGEAVGVVSVMVGNMLIVMLVVGFIMAEAAGFPRKLRAVLGDPKADLGTFSQILESINRYIWIKTQVSLLTGLVATGVCFVSGVEYPILWGLLAFLLNYIPTFGSLVAALPPCFLALVDHGLPAALLCAFGYIGLNVLFGNIIEPRWMGRGLGLSPLVVLVFLVFWGWMWGPVGMVLAVPLTMLLKIWLEHTEDLRWVALLLSSSRAAAEAEASRSSASWSSSAVARIAGDESRRMALDDSRRMAAEEPPPPAR